ncbi:hypothetical protein [Longimicrobium terrae]|uniref:Uncharacterized protein n=1 Tax=Longimicrobium terrae TaxID=1639882 RepID=A0A841H4Q2_9BACT|nr:hypothetical protein [Longimicrobium terrae]MBB4638761.1 hypothetical protein [Longimicrobium terrae]MBB6073000.1 hypothetical protein [Longimicrobium terrae]NNC33124.1 hypothetical protein [Longimicrobium terrae]
MALSTLIRRRGSALVLSVVLLCGCGEQPAQTPEGSPAWIVERFYGREPWPGQARYIGGELAPYANQPSPGSQRPADARVTIRPIRQDTHEAVFAVTLGDATSVQDAYLFLNNQGDGWQLVAYRMLWLPPLFYEMADSLAARPDPDEQSRRTLRAMRLATASDSVLRAHFLANRAGFNALVQHTMALADSSPVQADSYEQGSPPPPADQLRVRDDLRALDLDMATRDRNAPGCLLFHIGGMMDNSVGYLYAPSGCRVPAMTPGPFIYVEQIAPGWYLYKTT